MADNVVSACKDCLPWVCATAKKCSYEDDAFEHLSRKLLSCGALIFGTPIYWWDTSGMVRYFFLKTFSGLRTFGAPSRASGPFGIGVAGGTWQWVGERAAPFVPILPGHADEGPRTAPGHAG